MLALDLGPHAAILRKALKCAYDFMQSISSESAVSMNDVCLVFQIPPIFSLWHPSLSLSSQRSRTGFQNSASGACRASAVQLRCLSADCPELDSDLIRSISISFKRFWTKEPIYLSTILPPTCQHFLRSMTSMLQS